MKKDCHIRLIDNKETVAQTFKKTSKLCTFSTIFCGISLILGGSLFSLIALILAVISRTTLNKVIDNNCPRQTDGPVVDLVEKSTEPETDKTDSNIQYYDYLNNRTKRWLFISVIILILNIILLIMLLPDYLAYFDELYDSLDVPVYNPDSVF